MYKGIATEAVNLSQNRSIFANLNKDKLSLIRIRNLLRCSYTERESIFLMKDFCMQANDDLDKRIALEFLYMNGFYNELGLMIKENMNSLNQINRDWALTYDILLKKIRDSITPDQMIEMARDIETTDPILNLLLLLIDVYGHLKLFEFTNLGNKLELINNQISQIDNPFILEYLEMRKEEILFHYYWKRNELIMARKYAFKIINTSLNPRKQCDLLIYLAQTYVLEDYKKAMSCLLQARKLAENYQMKYHLSMIDKQGIPFTAAIFGETEGIETDDIEETAHLLIAKGENEKAIAILENLGSLTPFRAYYLGKAKRDSGLLKQSYQMFINERSDYFFARLPIKELEKINRF